MFMLDLRFIAACANGVLSWQPLLLTRILFFSVMGCLLLCFMEEPP